MFNLLSSLCVCMCALILCKVMCYNIVQYNCIIVLYNVPL